MVRILNYNKNEIINLIEFVHVVFNFYGVTIATEITVKPSFNHCSYECGLHEAKSREKKEDIDAKLSELRSNFTGFKGVISILPLL